MNNKIYYKFIYWASKLDSKTFVSFENFFGKNTLYHIFTPTRWSSNEEIRKRLIL